MTDHSNKPFLGRPPVDGTDDELEEWTESFLDQILGPVVDGDRAAPAVDPDVASS